MCLAAALIGPTRGRLRDVIVLGAPLLTLWFVWQVPDGVVFDVAFLDYRIEPLEGSSVRRLFATIFTLMAFVGGLYAFRQAKWYELAAAHAYAAGAIGVSFAGDLISLFLFWELMALFSTVVVWSGGTPAARAASRVRHPSPARWALPSRRRTVSSKDWIPTDRRFTPRARKAGSRARSSVLGLTSISAAICGL